MQSAIRKPSRGVSVGLVLVALLSVAGSAPHTAGGNDAPALDAFHRAAILERAASLPRLRSLLVSIRGEVIEEHYFNGASVRRSANLKSASKTIIAILVGIAIDRGYLEGVYQPIVDFFPDELAEAEAARRSITIEDLLTMRSGLETTSNRNYGRWVQSRHWVRHVLSRSLVARPGGPMIYSTGSTHLLSAILTRATGMSTLEFGRRHLARPLGITLPAWTRDPQGVYLGGNEMGLTPRAMLAARRSVSARGHRARAGRSSRENGSVRRQSRARGRGSVAGSTATAGGFGRWPGIRRTTPGGTAVNSSSWSPTSTP